MHAYNYVVPCYSSVVSDEISFLQKSEDPGTEFELPIKKGTGQPLTLSRSCAITFRIRAWAPIYWE